MDQTSLAPQEYDVYTPAIQFSTVDFTQTPACGYTLEYEYMLKDEETGEYIPLPDWIQVVGHLSFDVFTDNPENLGKYKIAVVGKVPAAYMENVYTEELLIDLWVMDGCEDDDVTNLTTIDDTLYYIAEDGLVSYQPTWTHSELGCPILYMVSRIVDGVERDLTPEEALVLTHNSANGWLDLQTSDYALDGEVWTIRLFMRSEFSKSDKKDGAHVFAIEFRDICWDSELTAAIFDLETFTYDVWQMQSNIFTKMVDESQGLLCGGYTHEIIYLDGPKFNETYAPFNADLSDFTLEEVDPTRVEMKGAVQDFSWLGTHTMLIKSTNGVLNTAETARGDQGLFRWVLSDPIEITIVNPCLRSVVNDDEGLVVDDLAVPGGQTLIALNYTGPTDSISVTYGNGYDKCGNLTYEWFDKRGELFVNPYFSSNFTIADRVADHIFQNLTSTATGTTLYDYFTLVVSLVEYPTATPAAFQVRLQYRECFPFNFKGPKINDI